MGKMVKANSYPEGVWLLAKELDLPIPPDKMEERKKFLEELMINFVMSGLY